MLAAWILIGAALAIVFALPSIAAKRCTEFIARRVSRRRKN